jgi:hypothetical protein
VLSTFVGWKLKSVRRNFSRRKRHKKLVSVHWRSKSGKARSGSKRRSVAKKKPIGWPRKRKPHLQLSALRSRGPGNESGNFN